MGELSAVQRSALEGLHIIDRFCTENGISYVLLAGSALGAVREKGFIPWDDDIDIGMTLPEYDRFCSLFNLKLPEGFFWSTPATNSRHPRFYGKLLYRGHQCVDVFPLVRMPEGGVMQRIYWFSHKLYQHSLEVHLGIRIPTGGRARSIAVHTLCRCFAALHSREQLISRAEGLMHRYEGKPSSCYCNLCSRYAMQKEMIATPLLTQTQMLRFEDGVFPVFLDTDTYLKHLYGDYMTPPDPMDRMPVHEDLDFEIAGQSERGKE